MGFEEWGLKGDRVVTSSSHSIGGGYSDSHRGSFVVRQRRAGHVGGGGVQLKLMRK